MSITPLPSAPAITDTTSEFNTKAFNWVAALDPFTTEANALLATCEDAATTAGAAIALVGNTAWVSGTTYDIGDAVYSPIDLQTYRRKTNGAGTTDPSADSTNWTRISLADPANQITAIATGSLANGDAVAINSDGTVSVVSETAASFGTPVTFETGSTVYISSTFDSTNNKVVIAYSDSGNSNYGTAVVGTVFGTSISFGTPVTFNSGATYDLSICFDSTNNKVVISYSIFSVANGKAIVGTVSGTSISFGTAVTFETGITTDISSTFDFTNNKVVIAYSDNGNSFYGTAVVGTVSGTSISFGTPVVFKSSNTKTTSITFDSNNTKIVIAFSDNGNSNYGTAVVGTVSGTSISFGTVVVFESANTNYPKKIIFDSTNYKVVIFYSDFGNSNYGTAVVGTVSGTSIIFGTPVTFNNVATTYVDAIYNSINNKIEISYRNGDDGSIKFIQSYVLGNLIAFESTESIGWYGNYIGIVFDSFNNKIIINFQDSNGIGLGKSIIRSPYETTSSRFIGFSDSAVSNGQTATIKTVGALVTNQTGLTTGSVYYVQGDGSLATTENEYTNFAGTAISSTSMIVKG